MNLDSVFSGLCNNESLPVDCSSQEDDFYGILNDLPPSEFNDLSNTMSTDDLMLGDSASSPFDTFALPSRDLGLETPHPMQDDYTELMDVVAGGSEAPNCENTTLLRHIVPSSPTDSSSSDSSTDSGMSSDDMSSTPNTRLTPSPEYDTTTSSPVTLSPTSYTISTAPKSSKNMSFSNSNSSSSSSFSSNELQTSYIVSSSGPNTTNSKYTDIQMLYKFLYRTLARKFRKKLKGKM